MPPKIHPYQIKKLGIKMNGKQIVQQSFRGNFTKEEITKYVQEKSNVYKNKGMPAQIQTNVRWYPGMRGWRSSKYTPVGETIDWYNDQDWYPDDTTPAPTHFSEFRLYLARI